MVLHETKSGQIVYQADIPAVVAKFTGFMKSEEFKDFMKEGLKHLVSKLKSQNTLWLADTTTHKVQPKSDTDWVVSEWNPAAKAAGLTHVAFLLPNDTFAKASVNNYQSSAVKQGEIAIGMFPTYEQAAEWYQSAFK